MNANTNIYDLVMEQLRTSSATRREIASGAGVPFSTVCKIAQRQTLNPGVHHVQALHDYFSGAHECGCGKTQQQEAA